MNKSKNTDIEIYQPTQYFRCHQPVYLRAFQLENGTNATMAYDYYKNTRHLCYNRAIIKNDIIIPQQQTKQ